MAEYYVDHGVYGTSTNRLGLDNPTWGVPQEGDGSAKTAATAASTATITLTAQPAANDTLTICGITLTAITTAPTAGSKNFQIGASIQATADNIASCINACTDTTISTSLSAATPQMRNIFFARSVNVNSGGIANAVEIMTRIGSTTFNYNASTNTAPAITTNATWNGSAANLPTISQFAGGSGGCWGWLINPTAIGASSSIAVVTYGIGVAKPYVLPPGVSAFTYTDFVYARTGSGKTIDLAGNSWARNVTYPLNLIFDSNTRWTTDSGTGVVKIIAKPNTGAQLAFKPDNSGSVGAGVLIAALKKGGLTFEFDLTNITGPQFSIGGTGIAKIYNLVFTEKASTSPNAFGYIGLLIGGGNGTLHVVSCQFVYTVARTNLPNTPFSFNNLSGYIKFEDNDFIGNFIGSQTQMDATPLMSVSNVTGVVHFEGNRFSTGSNTRYRWFNAVMTVNNFQVVLERNSGTQLSSTGLGIQSVASYLKGGNALPSLSMTSADPGFAFRHERTTGIVDWDYDSNTYPYLNAVQPDGTQFSYSMQWFGGGYVIQATPLNSGKITKLNRLVAGQRTVTLEMLFDPTKTIDNTHLVVRVNYVDTTGVPRRESTYLSGVFNNSSAAWTFRGSTYSSYVPKNITLTTSYQVAQNTEISVEVMLCNPPSGTSGTRIFFDPEYSLT